MKEHRVETYGPTPGPRMQATIPLKPEKQVQSSLHMEAMNELSEGERISREKDLW